MRPDVVIVGAGVMGCAVARELASLGMKTRVLERSVPGAEASSAAAGILAPSVEANVSSPLFALGVASRDRHDALAASLRAELGVDVGFRRCGALSVAFDPEEERALHLRASALGSPARLLSGDEARLLEPRLSPAVTLALSMPHEAQLEPRSFLRALALSAERKGAVFSSDATVRRVVVERGVARGVETDRGLIECDRVVVAAGSWTSLVPGIALPSTVVEPVKGQILATDTRPALFGNIVFGAGGYVLARPDGRVLCGSTEERVGFARDVTFEGLASIVRIATRLAPSLASAPVREHWAGFRPGTPDDLPLVGPCGPTGLLLAAGHYRNGILLAPITAALVASFVQGERPDVSSDVLTAIDPRRFGASA